MAFYNIAGTTSKTFKVGPNGVQLASSAVINGKQYLVANNQTDQSGDPLKLAYENDIYDSFISSQNIEGIVYDSTNGTLTVNLRSGSAITIGNAGDVSGPVSSTNNNIVLFDGTSGKTIKDSGRSIVDSVSDSDSASLNLPSAGAVVGYVGTLSEALKQRLLGRI